MIKKAVGTPNLKLVLGTDTAAGAHGHNADEIVERVRQGNQRPMDAIVSATSMSAKSLNPDKTISTLALYEADFIAVDGDPTTEIAAVTRVAFAAGRPDVTWTLKDLRFVRMVARKDYRRFIPSDAAGENLCSPGTHARLAESAARRTACRSGAAPSVSRARSHSEC